MTIALEGSGPFPTMALGGELASGDADELERTIDLLDVDPVIIVDLEGVTALAESVAEALVRQQELRAGRIVVVIAPEHPLRHAIGDARQAVLNVVADRTAALERAAVLRDVGGVTFSRDGV